MERSVFIVWMKTNRTRKKISPLLRVTFTSFYSLLNLVCHRLLYFWLIFTFDAWFSFVIEHLQTDKLETRLKAVNLVGDIISLPGSTISEALQTTFSEFLKRLTDRDFGVRMSVLEHAKSCLLSNPLRPEAPQIICESLGCMYKIFSPSFLYIFFYIF